MGPASGEVEGGLGPLYGIGEAALELLLIKIHGLDDCVAGGPVTMFMIDEPGKKVALRDVRTQQSLANFFAEWEGRNDFFHTEAEHGGEEAEQTEEVLLGGVGTREAGGEFAEAPADKGHAQDLFRLAGIEFAGDGKGGNAAEDIFSNGEDPPSTETTSWRTAQRGELMRRRRR